jgi:ribosomal protein S1
VSDEILNAQETAAAPESLDDAAHAPDAAGEAQSADTQSAQADAASTAPAANPLDAVKLRALYKGTVTRVDLGGAFVDIGVGVDGFIHISQLLNGDKPVTRVADVLKPGDEIDVYVMRVNSARKRIDLTMHKPAAFDWDNLEIGAKLDNVKVVSVESFGAFVDFDGPKHGLIPFNLMPRGMRPKVGDPIENVWVVEVDAGRRRIGLTMIEPPARPWEGIKRGDTYTGRVTRIDRNGAFVDIGAEREGLVRSSSLGLSFVDIRSLVSEGEDVTVRVTKVDPGKKQIDLTLADFNADDYALSSGPDEELSPIAAAMHRARRQKRAQAGASAAADRPVKKNNPQNELLERTLQQMQSQKKAN